MENYDFVYFTKNFFGHRIPIATGSSNMLDSIFEIDEGSKKNLEHHYGKTFKRLYVLVDGTEFVVRASRSASSEI